MKFSFEKVQADAFRLLNLAAVSVTDSESSAFFYGAFVAYLKSSGWSEKEFDAELLNRINRGWSPQYN